MVNIVDEYWEVEKDGTWYSLHTYSYHVKTIYGGRTSPPSLRGENQYVSGVAGSFHNSKIPDEQTLTLGGWLTNKDANNAPLHATNKKVGFNTNWRAIRGLLWRENGEQFGIRRRWYGADGNLITATGTAEFGGNMALAENIPSAGAWSCDLIMSDPYFYGTPFTQTLAVGVAQNIVNPGDVTAHPKLVYNGILSNPQIDHGTKWMKIGTAIAALDSVTVETSPRILTVVRASDSASLIGALTRNGSRAWLPLKPGTNSLLLSATSGTGTVDVTVTPGYL